MRRLIMLPFVVLLAFASPAHAQSETDRLREALRSATAQTRSLEDQRTQLQAKVAEADRLRQSMQQQIDALRTQLKDVETAHRTAVETFNQRLEERNETLERWKAAYAEAADVARSKDGERAKFESESKAFRASTKACEARNEALAKLGRELLQAYDDVHFGDVIAAREPVLGLRRVDVQNMLQDYRSKIREQKIKP
ncbi:hypothetical protein [Blastochloris viridis]|uniref:ATPase n=1 Tax=Blastochloris viridis TaxID=1079 RepID=A0A0H5BE48_BLAVI|nr:hypothetical protein [Blastochloris viridis]ALK09638.1 hypothetical protein BVIR_1864 [Blastochloris viridis]BAS00473.1 ATPase [Blastochloris viridis]CUU42301.1 hypothetical protein BVIRIDIS_13090 [Blastochloris viridis]